MSLDARFNERLISITERVVIIQPGIAVEFAQLQTNLISLVRSELWQFFEYLSFGHAVIILVG